MFCNVISDIFYLILFYVVLYCSAVMQRCFINYNSVVLVFVSLHVPVLIRYPIMTSYRLRNTCVIFYFKC